MATEGQNKLRPNMVTATTTTTSTITTLNGIENKIENVTGGLPSECFRFLHDRVLPANQENAMMICNYMSSLKSEANPSDGHRRNTIILLCKFSIFKNIKTKPFMEITRAIWVLKDKTEYYRFYDLYNDAQYNNKLLKHYGYNKSAGKFNLNRFPVTKTDSQIEGIEHDIDIGSIIPR
jgi:hypothetical protein